eukprot:jgi/Botrbrau1/7528/Bobra.0019s0016.1
MALPNVFSGSELPRNFVKAAMLLLVFFQRQLSCEGAVDRNRPLLSYNSSLSSLIKSYEERHRLATSNPSSGARYIITYEERGGMGNTIPGLVTAFFLSLVTNRTLLLERYNYLVHIDHGDLDFRYSEQEKRWKAWGQPAPERLWLGGGDYPKLLVGNFTGGIWDSERALEFNYGGDYPLGHVQANPNLKEFMEIYFEGRDPFFELSKFFVRPNDFVIRSVQNAENNLFRQHMIGMHLRRLKGLAEISPKVKDYGLLADAIQRQHGWDNEKTGIFVSSDVPSVIEELSSSFPDKNFIYMEKNMSKGLQPSGNPGTIFDAFVDLFLLSKCDEIILTFGSSFGSTAAGLAGVNPYVMLYGGVLLGDGNIRKEPRPGFFYHAYTSEPCCWSCSGIWRKPNSTHAQVWARSHLWLHHSQCHW